MSATVTTFQPNPFETARAQLIEALKALPVPRPFDAALPFPDDFDTIAEHVRAASRLFDGWLGAVGTQVDENTWVRISTPLFNGVYLDAVDGWATDEVLKAGRAAEQEQELAYAQGF